MSMLNLKVTFVKPVQFGANPIGYTASSREQQNQLCSSRRTPDVGRLHMCQ